MTAHKHAHHQTAITAPVRMSLTTGGVDLPVQATLSYTSGAPFAIQMSVCADHAAPVVWMFARELLVDGRERPAGLGDVQIFPADGCIVIELSSPDGQARLRANRHDVEGFIDSVVTLVPQGTERPDWDLDEQLAKLASVRVAQGGDQ